MQKNKMIYLLVLLIVISSLVLVTVTSFCTDVVAHKFTDVNENDWFSSDVEYVYGKKLMNGTSDTTFAPDDPTTRGMIVTILWRLDGEEKETNSKAFADVVKDSYYYDAVVWASANAIVSGYDDTTFGPEDFITREQLAAILYRYVAHKNLDTAADVDISKFKDFAEISDYAVDAMKWANANGIINGITSDTISPQGNATRCQVAAILKRICENIIGRSKENSSKEQISTENSVINNSNGGSSGNRPIIGAGGGPDDEEENVAPEEDFAEQPEIKVNTTYGKPGEIIEVTLDLQKNPGILGMVLNLEYDEDAFSLINAESGEAVADVLAFTPSGTLSSGAKFVWDGIDIAPEDIRDGRLLTLEFEILDSVTVGKRYPLKISYNPGDIVDAQLKEVNLRIHQGYIEIEEFEEDEENEF